MFVMLALILLAIGIIVRILSIQFGDDRYWYRKSQDNTLVKRHIIAERGNIYTHDGRLLSTTLPTFDLYLDTRADGLTDSIWNRSLDSLTMMLAKHRVQNKSQSEWITTLKDARKNNSRYLKIAQKIQYKDYKTYINFPLFRNPKNKSGLIVIQHNSRKMPFGMLAQRTIGYTRDSNRYKVGLEGRFDNELAGENKVVLMQKVAGGVYMPQNVQVEYGAKPGLDIVTTLDINLQDIAEAALMEALINSRADKGTVILMNVKTGAIKAIANLKKDYDSKLGQTVYNEGFNYAIGEANEPGSVIKLASVMALLDEGFCDQNYQIYLNGGTYMFHDKKMIDAHPSYATVSLAEAFQQSSNIGISRPVYKFFDKKRELFYKKFEQYHLTEPYGIELHGEAKPLVKKPNKWTGITLPWMSIGYELKLTPLQILGLYASVANNGKMMKPYLVSKIMDNNQVVESFEPTVLNEQIAKPETISIVQNMLKNVVENGTAKTIKSYYPIAGKTGTNLLATKNGKGYSQKYLATFVGYFPADKPEYACIVAINNPTIGSHYGGDLSAPVFKKIADVICATDIQIHPSIDQLSNLSKFAINSFRGLKSDLLLISKNLGWKTVSSDSTSEWASAIAVNNKLVLKPTFINNKTMPNLINMNIKDALYILENIGVNVSVVGKGKIVEQSISPGTRINRGHQVTLKLG